MADLGEGETRSTISGGTQYGPVLMGRNFRDIHIENIVQTAAAPVALNQLPPLVAGFTGRGSELAEITALLDPAGNTEAVVVSAVAGLAGVGKTALAIQTGRAALKAGWFPGGVLFIDLHGYDDAPVQPGQALDALLRALGVAAEHIPPGVEERSALYRSVLAQSSEAVLIIGDNASAEAQVRPLLPGPGPHRVVVTSRHTLAGMGARLIDVAVLDDETALVLLDRALRDARPDDNRIRADLPGSALLAEICAGLPLALQITAALLKADPFRTVSDLANELADEMQRLKALRYDDGGGTSAPSVAAAFELSYQRLDEDAARMFQLLPLNPGPDVSTTAVAALADLPVRDARTTIAQLVRAHLVEAAAGAADRWRMHDLLLLYARQLLNASADADQREKSRDRLLCYYLSIARAADAHLTELSRKPGTATLTNRDSFLAWLDAECSCLVAAVTMAANTGRDQIAVKLPQYLGKYMLWRRRFDDWLSVIMIGRNAAQRLGDRTGEVESLGNLGVALREARRFEEAITTNQEVVAMFREIGDRHGEARALGNLGAALIEARRFDEAITTCQKAAAICREVGDRHGEGTALDNLGVVLTDVRRLEEAITTIQQAVAIFRETGDRLDEGMALGNLGGALVQVRRFEDAINVYQEELAICREVGDRYGEGVALDGLGVALRDVGRFEEAIATCQKAAAIYRETGDRHGEGRALDNLGTALREARRFEEAITTCQESAVIYRETGDRNGEGIALNSLGAALHEARRFEEAITTCQESAAIYRETGDRHGEAFALNSLGLALRNMDRLEEATAAHKESAAIFKEVGDQHGEHAALTNMKLARAVQRMLGQRYAPSEADL